MTATEDQTGSTGVDGPIPGDESGEQAAQGHFTSTTSAGSMPAAAEAVVRRRRVQTRQKRVTLWGILVTLVCVLLLAALAYVGYQASLRVGGGTESRVTDPTAPGYVADPRPTDTDLFVLTDAEGGFASALVVVPDQSGQGGTAVPISPSFVVPEYEGSPPMFLADVFAEGGIDGTRERLGIALTFAIDSAETVPAEAIAELAGGESIQFENVDNLVARADDGTEEVRYPAGDLSLEPDQIVEFMAFEGADDPAPNQALRTQTVWEQLLDRAAGSPPAGLPEGERSLDSDSPGFAEALSSLLAGEVRFESVPMERVPVPDSYLVAWMPDPAAIDQFVARVVPLPLSPAPGVRTAVSILNGTTDPDATAAAVPEVVSSGGWVSLVGNADSFDVASTTVEYSGAAAADTANRIASMLGVEATEATGPIESASVRVTLGGAAQ